MPYSPVVGVLQGLPEGVVLLALVYALLGARIHPGRILLLGLAHTTLIVSIRLAGTPFPAHTLFALITMSVIVAAWERVPLQRVILAWAAALSVLIVLETGFLMLISHLLGIPVAGIFDEPALRILSGWPHIIVLALVAWRVRRRGGLNLFKGA